MNSLVKSKEEINKIRQGGAILHEILKQTAKLVRPGISTWELNRFAEDEIRKAGARPSFKNYGDPDNPFPAGLCTSINSIVVHGIPSKDALLETGDIIGLDLGIEYKGMYTDAAITVPCGKINFELQELLDVTRQSLIAAIEKATAGNKTGDIGHAIQSVAEAAGFNVVRDLVGHGVGYAVHEEPNVPCYGKPNTGVTLKEGMVLAIEPMVVIGDYPLIFGDDGWTIYTEDGGYSAHFEHTVVVGKKSAEIVT